MAPAVHIPSKNDGRELRPRSDVSLDHLSPHNIVLREQEALKAYVANHPDLAALLEEMCAAVRSAFGSGAELSLEIYEDPEQPDQYLTLVVRLEKYESGIMDRIDAVAGHFMTQLESASGHLHITTDFRRPRGADGV